MKRSPTSTRKGHAPKQKESQARSLHTPGPWRKGRPDTNIMGETLDVCIHAKSKVVARATRYLIARKFHPSTIELEANATLIAAAPELLEVCEAILRLGEGYGQLTHIIAAAEVAIRKASSVPDASKRFTRLRVNKNPDL